MHDTISADTAHDPDILMSDENDLDILMSNENDPNTPMSNENDTGFTIAGDKDLSESEDSESDRDSECSEESQESDEGLLQFPQEFELNTGDNEDSDSHSDMDSSSSDEDPLDDLDEGLTLPKSLLSLRRDLLGDYKPTMNPPSVGFVKPTLTKSEELSLKHYIAWKSSNGTVKAYKKHAYVLQDGSGVEILSLHSVRKLSQTLTGLNACQVDICPNSCIAYIGKYEMMVSCPYVKDHKTCGLPRYQSKKNPSSRDKPQAQMMYLPVMATIKAMFANEETAQLMRHRDKCLQQALHVTAEALRQYSDFGNSKVHMHHYNKMGLFEDPRHVALAISTDGAQLTMKKQSDTWMLIIILLNLCAEIRIKFGNVFVAFSTPGPLPPGDLESFFWILFQEMAMASEGIWTWDAVDSSYFLNKAYICMALGDMLGSAKLNGMAGHSAIYGDRFTMVKGARTSLKKGSKAQYYPISPPENAKYNPERPNSYNLDSLPLRQEHSYWSVIAKLESAPSKAISKSITKSTGVSRLPLCAASPAFTHPTFFPLDPFHLLYENNTAFIWDLWTTLSEPGERVHLSTNKARAFGQLVSKAMSTLPPSFCGPVRDIFLKRQSQYKIYEWMALVHWYIIPIGIELEFDPGVLQNYSYFVEAVEFAMTIKARSLVEVEKLHTIVKKFLLGFEKLYIGDDPKKISRARLCVFQLIHLPRHIEWFGSVRLGSQATVERAIGTMGHQIRSKKAPFANLANNIYERELIKLLLLYYPSLDHHSRFKVPGKTKLIKKTRISNLERKPGNVLYQCLEAICHWLKIPFSFDLQVERYGKFSLPIGHVLASKISESQKRSSARSSRYFMANEVGRMVYGEAIAFFEVAEVSQTLVVYHPIVQVKIVLGVLRGNFSKNMEVLPVTSLCDLTGIWSYDNDRVYILRKHPALDMLNEEEKGNKGDDDNDDEIEEEEINE